MNDLMIAYVTSSLLAQECANDVTQNDDSQGLASNLDGADGNIRAKQYLLHRSLPMVPRPKSYETSHHRIHRLPPPQPTPPLQLIVTELVPMI